MRLQNKVSIVTGGASGMGAAESALFASEGSNVVVADMKIEDGMEVVDEIKSTGGNAIFMELDVTEEERWEVVVADVLKQFGTIDILVNNAGLEAYDRLMNVNSRGVFLGMRSVLPTMCESGSGSIVNISSISGIVGQSYVHMGYNASKGAVRIMTKSAAVQYAEKGIRVNSVHPGIMPPMVSSVGTADPETRKIMLEDVPMNRVGLVGEVANAVLFLASDEASYITGAELPVDGGLTAR